MERVETRDTFLDALNRGGFNLILSDFALPAFDGLSAIRLDRSHDPHLPVILVSGTLGEEEAIDYGRRCRLTWLVANVPFSLSSRLSFRRRPPV